MIDNQYETLLQHVVDTGTYRSDRTGVGTKAIFDATLRYDLANGFPLITTKRVSMKAVTGELLWFLSGSVNANDLRTKYGVTIWDEWAGNDGSLGPIYGWQWRNWGGEARGQGIDQIANLITGIRKDPFGRRHIVSAWNVTDLPDMALSPCHAFFQFFVESNDAGAPSRLSCKVTQRSADMFLGVPFNIASYALLTHMVAQQVGLDVGELIWSGGDVHVYLNHLDQVATQVSRDVLPFPTLALDPALNIDDYTPQDVVIENYRHGAPITAPVAV